MLKGRLHQAVSLAQVGEADRWPKIKHLAEDVLQQLGVKKCTLWLVADGLLKVVVFFPCISPKPCRYRTNPISYGCQSKNCGKTTKMDGENNGLETLFFNG